MASKRLMTSKQTEAQEKRWREYHAAKAAAAATKTTKTEAQETTMTSNTTKTTTAATKTREFVLTGKPVTVPAKQQAGVLKSAKTDPTSLTAEQRDWAQAHGVVNGLSGKALAHWVETGEGSRQQAATAKGVSKRATVVTVSKDDAAKALADYVAKDGTSDYDAPLVRRPFLHRERVYFTAKGLTAHGVENVRQVVAALGAKHEPFGVKVDGKQTSVSHFFVDAKVVPGASKLAPRDALVRQPRPVSPKKAPAKKATPAKATTTRKRTTTKAATTRRKVTTTA